MKAKVYFDSVDEIDLSKVDVLIHDGQLIVKGIREQSENKYIGSGWTVQEIAIDGFQLVVELVKPDYVKVNESPLNEGPQLLIEELDQ